MGRERGYQTFIRAQHREMALFFGHECVNSRSTEDVIAYYINSLADIALSVHNAVQVCY